MGAANRLGKPEIGEQYLQDVAAILGGKLRRYEKSWPDVVDANGRIIDAASLLAVGD